MGFTVSQPKWRGPRQTRQYKCLIVRGLCYCCISFCNIWIEVGIGAWPRLLLVYSFGSDACLRFVCVFELIIGVVAPAWMAEENVQGIQCRMWTMHKLLTTVKLVHFTRKTWFDNGWLWMRTMKKGAAYTTQQGCLTIYSTDEQWDTITVQIIYALVKPVGVDV